MSNLGDRLFVGAHSPGSLLWVCVVVILAATAWSAIFGDAELVLEGLLSAAVLVGVISISSRALGWKFWPW